ncbi:proton-coupled folate transporter-like [Branchiostoma floridae x Branchiostoma belcheri]
MAEEMTATSDKKVRFQDPSSTEAIKPYCPVTVEPIQFFVLTALFMTSSLRQQYIYYRIGNGTVNEQGSSCYGNSSNSSAYQERQNDQAEATQWATAIQLTSGIPALVVTVMIGSLSDKLGRKLNITIPVIGSLINFTVAAFVVQFNLPIAALLPGYFFLGLGGSAAALSGGCYAYIADITLKGRSRYFRQALLAAAAGASGIVAALGGNFWFQQLGFPLGISQPFWFTVGLTGFCLLYTIFAVKETCPRKPGSQLCAVSNITGIFQLFKVKRRTPRWPIGVLGLVFSLIWGMYNAIPTLIVTYLVGPPFCWSPSFVGFFQGAVGAGFFVSAVAIKLFSKYPYGLMMVGYLSSVGCLTLAGLSPYTPNRDVAMFISAAIGCMLSASNTVLRTTMSKMVGPEEQGSLFGLVSFITSLSGVVFVPLWNFVYSRTIFIMPGMIWLIFSAVNVFCAILTGFVKFMAPELEEDNLVEEEEKEDYDTTKL